MDEKREKGISVFGDLLGEQNGADLREQIKSGAGFGSETGKFSADFAFGAIWSRDGLERKQRSLVVLGILIALRQVEELKLHVKIALANGLTVKEIEEVLYQALPYAGFPAVNTAKNAMIEALEALGVPN